jgi:hypothetical protein
MIIKKKYDFTFWVFFLKFLLSFQATINKEEVESQFRTGVIDKPSDWFILL